MDYTNQKMKQALLEKQTREIMKRLKLEEHKHRVKIATQILLPYRILKENEDKGTYIGRFYPEKHDTIPSFWEWMEQKHPHTYEVLHADFGKRWEFVTNQNEIINGKTHDDLKEEYKKDNEQFKTEQERRVVFGKFYIGYDFDDFSEFDFWGDHKHTPAETEQFRNLCKEVQAEQGVEL